MPSSWENLLPSSREKMAGRNFAAEFSGNLLADLA
jgi:hypothetical protein